MPQTRLIYCKQCNRLISQEEIDSGEAYISKDGTWCQTCAIGLGYDVTVRPAAPRRRRRGTRMHPAAGQKSSLAPLAPLAALFGAILVGVGLTTALFVWLSRSRGRAAQPAVPAGTDQAPAPQAPPAEPPPETAPAPAPEPTPPPPPAEPAPPTPKILSPEEIRAKAKAEFDRLQRRAKALEDGGRLVDAMEVYAEFAFEYRHTEYHGMIQKERGRIELECERRFGELQKDVAKRLAEARPSTQDAALRAAGGLIGKAIGAIDSTSVRPKMAALRSELGDRFARHLAQKIRTGGAPELPVTPILWRAGPAVSVVWKSQSAEVTFADAGKGREIALVLPRGVTWDLSAFSAINFVVPGATGRARI